MREKLLRAWLTVLGLWWLGVLFAWSVSNKRLAKAAQALHAAGSFWPAPPKTVTALNAWRVLGVLLGTWTLPVLALGLTAAVVSAVGVASVLRQRRRARHEEHHAGDAEAGLTVNMGVLPRPVWSAKATQLERVRLNGEYAKRIHELPKVYVDLIYALLAYLNTHKEAYVGPGHQGTLLDHSLHVLVQALDGDMKTDPLLLVGALAHDAGKTLAWKKTDEGRWERVGEHDTLSARLVSSFAEFLALPLSEQRTLLLALAYGHKSARMPQAAGVEPNRLQALMEGIHAADRTATREEKKVTLQQVDMQTTMLKAFEAALGRIEFQRPGIKKGARASGWRHDGRVFLLEPGFRQALISVLPEDVVAALGGDYRPKGGLAGITTALLDTLRQTGWLVEEHEGMKAKPPLWRMKSGEKEFAGVIVVDVPERLWPTLPKNTPFPLVLTGPLFVYVAPGGKAAGSDMAPAGNADGPPAETNEEAKKRRLLQASMLGAAATPGRKATATPVREKTPEATSGEPASNKPGDEPEVPKKPSGTVVEFPARPGTTPRKPLKN